MPEGDVVVDVVLKEVEGVDLGGSVLWAPYNVGASKPTEYGDYFAWGETSPKTIYNWDSYEYCNGVVGTYPQLTKYNTSSKYGTVDNKTVIETSDDVAAQKWKGNWRMPTLDEMKELLTECTCTWVSNYKDTNVSGYEITTSDNSIFLPAAGRYINSSVESSAEYVYYWANSIHSGDDRSNDMFGYSDGLYTSSIYRYYGYTIRPVKSKS